MKRAILFFFVGFIFLSTNAQQVKQLQFREESYDFGSVSEHKGPVTHEFVFTNTSNRPVKIINVQASCGCTTPGWSKEPVAPGKTGYVQASFDPAGRPGFFNKSLTVTTDLEANPIILQIKGQVSSDEEGRVDETGFTVSKGNLKFKTSAFNMGKVLIRDEYAVKEFPVVNGGSKPIIFSQTTTPKHIKVEVEPKQLAAGAKGTIRISYNGALKNQYGFQSDNVEITTTDDDGAVKSFSVYATMEDYFPQLTAEDFAKAPILKLGETSIDLGRVKMNSEIVREVEVFNNGRTDLVIKAVQGNCTCVKATVDDTTIKPGKSAKIKVTFNPLEREGTQQKAVTVYSNDPRNPVQRFTFSAYVE